MTREECFDDLREVWETYVDIAHPEYTTIDKRLVEDLLDDIEALLKG